MSRLLPFAFLIALGSVFGLGWIIVDVDPDAAAWYIFVLFVFLLFAVVFCLLGLTLYFVRTRFYRRYSASWYIKTSFNMAFLVAAFVALAATLAIFGQVTVFNIILTIAAVSLFAFWSYLGKRG